MGQIVFGMEILFRGQGTIILRKSETSQLGSAQSANLQASSCFMGVIVRF